MKQIPNDLFFAWVESEIAQGRSVQFLLKGVSMYPFIRGGKDRVVLFPCSHHELQPMDVVLFKYKGNHLLHRIIRRDGDLLTIKGDGSYVAIEVCNVNDVIGKVYTIIRPSGKEISVADWKWRFPSFVWSKMGILRNPILKILHHTFLWVNEPRNLSFGYSLHSSGFEYYVLGVVDLLELFFGSLFYVFA